MARDLPKSTKVCVVGGGLSGLTVAYRIATKRPDLHVELIEKSDRLGGVIETWTRGDWVCDIAVNATRAHPAFWRLVDDLGLGESFCALKPRGGLAMDFHSGKVPEALTLDGAQTGAVQALARSENGTSGPPFGG